MEYLENLELSDIITGVILLLLGWIGTKAEGWISLLRKKGKQRNQEELERMISEVDYTNYRAHSILLRLLNAIFFTLVVIILSLHVDEESEATRLFVWGMCLVFIGYTFKLFKNYERVHDAYYEVVLNREKKEHDEEVVKTIQNIASQKANGKKKKKVVKHKKAKNSKE